MGKKELKNILEQAILCVVESGKLIKNSLGKNIDIRHKGEIDLVTEVDIAVEKELKKGLKEIYDAEFLAEESAPSGHIGDNSLWIVDPIDGTTNFAHGLPMVATSVALFHRGKIVLGIVNLPILDEVFSAYLGGGACLNGEKIGVSSTTDLKNSLIATGFPYSIRQDIDEVMEKVRSVLLSSQGLRRMGAAAIDLAYVACGRFDGFFEQGLKPWDIAAGWLLVEEAGGTVTEYSKEPLHLNSPNILATNGNIHSDLSKLIFNKNFTNT